jgi:hypothetical protein
MHGTRKSNATTSSSSGKFLGCLSLLTKNYTGAKVILLLLSKFDLSQPGGLYVGKQSNPNR